MPCYSGFPRQSGRDAIKKRKQERRTRGERQERIKLSVKSERVDEGEERNVGNRMKCAWPRPANTRTPDSFFSFFFSLTIIFLNDRVGISIEEKRDRDNDYM